jgi:hypothetical protein
MKKLIGLLTLLFVVTMTMNAQKRNSTLKTQGWSYEGQTATAYTIAMGSGCTAMYLAYQNNAMYNGGETTAVKNNTAMYVSCAITGAAFVWGTHKLLKNTGWGKRNKSMRSRRGY